MCKTHRVSKMVARYPQDAGSVKSQETTCTNGLNRFPWKAMGRTLKPTDFRTEDRTADPAHNSITSGEESAVEAAGAPAVDTGLGRPRPERKVTQQAKWPGHQRT